MRLAYKHDSVPLPSRTTLGLPYPPSWTVRKSQLSTEAVDKSVDAAHRQRKKSPSYCISVTLAKK